MGILDVFKKMNKNVHTELRDYLRKDLKKTIDGWDKRDIYAISLYVYNYADNPCKPMVTLGYNTWDNYKSQIINASNEIEAKWNYAFWLQNEEYIFGGEETQPIVQRWIKAKGFQYYTYDEIFNTDKEPNSKTYEGITEAFMKELVVIVRELHESGFVEAQFGKSVPILIHELEYYDKIAMRNAEANPAEVIKEFVSYCCEG